MAIIVISVLPGVIEIMRQWKRNQSLKGIIR